MIWVVCVDDRGGTAFHGRRQSMDRLLRADLLAMADVEADGLLPGL